MHCLSKSPYRGSRSVASRIVVLVLWKMLASLKQFFESKPSPESFQKLELRLERLGREFSKVLLQYVLNHIESIQRPITCVSNIETFILSTCLSLY